LPGIKREDLDRLGITYGPIVRSWFRKGVRARCELLTMADRALEILGDEFIPLYRRAIYLYEERTHSRAKEQARAIMRQYYIRPTEVIMEHSSFDVRESIKEGYDLPT